MVAAFALLGCRQGAERVGTIEARERELPLTPATRSQVEASGGHCSPNPSGPVLCTWSSDQASCTLIFDSEDTLTRLDCRVESLSYSCNLVNGYYLCKWTDENDCAQVFTSTGAYVAYACGETLDDLTGGHGRDGGDAGVEPADAGIPGACPDGTDDCLRCPPWMEGCPADAGIPGDDCSDDGTGNGPVDAGSAGNGTCVRRDAGAADAGPRGR